MTLKVGNIREKVQPCVRPYEPYKLRGEVLNKKSGFLCLEGLVLDIGLNSMLSDGLFYLILKPKQRAWQFDYRFVDLPEWRQTSR